MDLALGFGQAHPSHASEVIATFPSAKNFFDPRPDRPQGAVVRLERFGREPAMALAHELRCSTFGFDRHLDRERIIGLVGINLARRIGDEHRGDSDVGLISRGRLDIADDARIFVRRNMGFITMRGCAAFVLHPACVLIAFAR